MTPLQSACLTRMKATSIANLEYFKLNFPRLFAQLAAEPPQTEVDISDQCDITLKYLGDEPESVARAVVEMEERLRHFADGDERPQLVAFQGLRTVLEGEVGHGPFQSFHYSNLDADFPNRVRSHFVKHYPDGRGLLRNPDFGERNLPIVLVFGVGLGVHLNRLLLEYDIRHLILVEPDIEQFRLSLFFHDFVGYGRLALEKGTSISFVTQTDVDEICLDIVALVQVCHPPVFIHGAGLFFASRDRAFVEGIRRVLPIKLWHAFFGMGYFDDELISLRHTYQNMIHRRPMLTRTDVVGEDAVAFIIGSGPSLDRLKSFIEQHKERAVLFSCGTALSSLEHAGIVPDFHLEKERPNVVLDVLTHTVSPEFKKKVRFIGASVVHPQVPELFAWSGLIAKSTDSSVKLLWPGEQGVVTLNVQPTITNTALNLCLALGFRTIYLIGVDFGFIDKSRHHSEHTVYLKALPQDEKLQRLFSKTSKSTLQVAGNFDPVVNTTNIFNAARMQMADDIRRVGRGVAIYNLNHGARIDGAEPTQADSVTIPGDVDKAALIEAIQSAFQVTRPDLRKGMAQILDLIDEFAPTLNEIVSVPLDRKRAVIEVMDALYQYVFSREVVATPLSVMFRGSLLQIMAYSYQILSIIEDEGEAAAKAAYDFSLMLDFIQAARNEIVRTFEEIDVLGQTGRV